MPIHTVKQGETVPGIALDRGIRNWRAVWDHPDNAAVKAERVNPNVLLPGDQITIPEKQDKSESAPTGARHQFRLGAEKSWLRLLIQDISGVAAEGASYKLTVEGKETTGKTGEDGLIEREIPANAREAKIVLLSDESEKGDEGEEIQLMIGDLDPPDEVSGWKARLNNLGYRVGDPDKTETDTDKVKSGLEEYQHDQGITVTGEADAATRSRLLDTHTS